MEERVGDLDTFGMIEHDGFFCYRAHRGKRHVDPMVTVGVDLSTVEGSAMDHKAVFEFRRAVSK